jgi:hypothetical protein
MLLDLLPDDRSLVRFPKVRWAKRGQRPSILLAYDADTETFSFIQEESGAERDVQAEMEALLADGKWRTVGEIAAKRTDDGKGGIGAAAKNVKKILEQRPDVFQEKNGREVGRSARATVFQLVGAAA